MDEGNILRQNRRMDASLYSLARMGKNHMKHAMQAQMRRYYRQTANNQVRLSM